jgi:hypothetical protein
VIFERRTRRSFEQEKLWSERTPQEEEATAKNRREIHEVPLIVGPWISCAKYSPSAQGVRTNAHRGSAFRFWRGESFIPCEIVSRELPILSKPSVVMRTGGMRSRGVGTRHFVVSRVERTVEK